MAATRIIKGDDSPFTFEVTHPNGDALDMSDYTADFFIKRSLQDADEAAEFHGTIDDGITFVYNVSDGVIKAIVDSTASANLRYGRIYYWYLHLTHTPTDSTYTPSRGTFLVVFPDTD